jgi:hypothetical protein
MVDAGMDYLKEVGIAQSLAVCCAVNYLFSKDSCGASQDPATAFSDYTRMSKALLKLGRPVYFSLCGWNPWYAPQGYGVANGYAAINRALVSFNML